MQDRHIFNRSVQCTFVGSGRVYDYRTAVGLSTFLGVFGVDRFYLGYPALGLLKLSTLGFFLLGWIADVVLITGQLVGPADGTAYRMGWYGPRVDPEFMTADEYRSSEACVT